MNEIFVKLINMSISASVIIALIILLRVVLKRMPKKYICILWALVAIRLLCPVVLETSFSAFNIVDNRLDANNLNITKVSNLGNIDAINNNKNVQKQINNLPAENSAIENSNSIVSEDNGNDLKTNNSLTNKTQNTGSNVPSNNASNLLGVLEIVWLLGVGGLTLYALISYINLKRKVSASINIRDNIYICDYINTPFILGVIKPRIYVQSGLTDSEMDFIIAHEQAHIKRLDYIWKPLGYIILTVYCFNPLCFVAYVLLCRDIEMACDEKVIKNMDKEGTALYSEILLKCSVHQRIITACPIAFGEVGAKKRIKNILSYKKPALWIAVVSSVICVIVAACFLTDAVKEDKSKSDKTKLEKTVSDKEFWKDNNVIAKNDNMIAYMDDTNHVAIAKRFSSEEPRKYIIGPYYGDAVPLCVVEKAEFINDEELKITYHADDGEGDYIRTDIINTKMYTDEELEKLALDYFYKEKGFIPHIIELEYIDEEDTVTIHLYDWVKKPKPEHTVTWGWYYIDRKTGKGIDIFDKEVDLNSEVIHIDDKAILKVLKNEEQYYDICFNEKRYFKAYKYNDFMVLNGNDEFSFEKGKVWVDNDFSVDYITQIDMDGDGKREVLLSTNQGNRLIFHSEKGQVYLFAFPFRQMKSINIDGKFDGSSSAVTTYAGKVKFAGKSCYYEELCYVDAGEKIFKLNGEKVKKKETKDYLSEFAGSYQPQWLKYKENNIK